MSTTHNSEIIPGVDEHVDNTIKAVENTPKGKLLAQTPFKAFIESIRKNINYINNMKLFEKSAMSSPKYLAVEKRHGAIAQLLAKDPKTRQKAMDHFYRYMSAKYMRMAATQSEKQLAKVGSLSKAAVLFGRYRDAFAGAHVEHFSDYLQAFDKEDDKMTEYMNQFTKKAVLSYGSDETSAVGSQLTEFEINNNAFRKTKNMTGLPKGTDWGYRHSKSAMIKKAVQTLTLESENPKFMERDYQQRSQNSRWLREVNRSSDSIRAPF